MAVTVGTDAVRADISTFTEFLKQRELTLLG